MGGGSYNYLNAVHKMTTDYSLKSREEIFRQSHLCPEMDIRKKPVRESRDSEEHPESFPIIIALDETGSMGMVPEQLIKSAFPDIIKLIMEAGIKNPQVCFCGFGDVQGCCEEAPVQIGEFESSDDLMEKWLQSIYLEGCGGGNNGEDPQMIWYVAAHHMKTDAFEKRGKKGVLIYEGEYTIRSSIEQARRLAAELRVAAREREITNTSRQAITHYIGDGCEKDLITSDILAEVQEKWDVYHIHIEHGSYRLDQTNWVELLDDKVNKNEGDWVADMKRIIPNIVIRSYNNSNDLVEVE